MPGEFSKFRHQHKEDRGGDRPGARNGDDEFVVLVNYLGFGVKRLGKPRLLGQGSKRCPILANMGASIRSVLAK